MFPVESEVTQSSLSLTIKTTDFHTDRTFVVFVLAEITRDLMLFVAYLRVRYGLSCLLLGITRLQRWERAKEYGLFPPEEVKEIILRHPNDIAFTEW